MNRMHDEPLTNTLQTRRKKTALFLLLSLMLFAATSPAAPIRSASQEGAVQESPAHADTPLAEEAVIELVEEELLPSLVETIEDESALTTIADTWEARMGDLVGKTRQQVLELLFADVTAVVSDKGQTDQLWASWNSNDAAETEEIYEAADEDLEGAAKVSDAGVNETLAFIKSLRTMQTPNEPNWEYGGKLVESRVSRLSDSEQKSIGQAIALANSVEPLTSNQSDETQRRQAIRSVLLVNFAVWKAPLGTAKDLVAKRAKTPLADLKAELASRLPLMDDSPARTAWDPKNFTDPNKFTSGKDFRFVVWGLMNDYTGRGLRFSEILKDPRNVVKTLLLSTSVIDAKHRATYYPYGLILKVPTTNIISTSGEDQAFKNYNAFETDLKDPKKRANFTQLQIVEIRDMQREVRRVASEHKFKTPAEVLKDTKGTSGESSYNEVTVMGTSPEGKVVEVVGIFVKVKDASGTPYTRQPPAKDKQPYVTEEVQKLIDDLSKRASLPICQIVDPGPK